MGLNPTVGYMLDIPVWKNVSKMHHFATISKKNSGKGTMPLPRPHSHWRGDTPSQTPLPSAPQNSRAFGALPIPLPFQNPGSAPWSGYHRFTSIDAGRPGCLSPSTIFHMNVFNSWLIGYLLYIKQTCFTRCYMHNSRLTKSLHMDTAGDCTYGWTLQANTNVINARRAPTATTLQLCQAECIRIADCNGIDYYTNQVASERCYLTGSWSGAINVGSTPNSMHYFITRNCPGWTLSSWLINEYMIWWLYNNSSTVIQVHVWCFCDESNFLSVMVWFIIVSKNTVTYSLS